MSSYVNIDPGSWRHVLSPVHVVKLGREVAFVVACKRALYGAAPLVNLAQYCCCCLAADPQGLQQSEDLSQH